MMDDETAARAETMAQMIATAVRLSQMLNITLDDAVSLVLKFGAAVESAVKVSKSAQ